MSLFKPLVLKDSIEIKTTPEKIWEFFINLDKNYKKWHPEAHVEFKWTKGKPMETGSYWYAEETFEGYAKKIKGVIGDVIPNRRIVFKCSFPVTLISPGFEWHIEPKGSNTVFTAISIIKYEGFYRKISKKQMDTAIRITKKHVKEEGENLKKILESSPK